LREFTPSAIAIFLDVVQPSLEGDILISMILFRLLFLFALLAIGYYAGSQQWGVAEFTEMLNKFKL